MKKGDHTFVPIHTWAHTIVPRHVCAHSCLCPNTFVPRHVCAQTRLCPDTFLPRHVCAHTCLCLDTFVPWHVIIVWSQSCLGRNVSFVPRLVSARTHILCPNTFVPRHIFGAMTCYNKITKYSSRNTLLIVNAEQ